MPLELQQVLLQKQLKHESVLARQLLLETFTANDSEGLIVEIAFFPVPEMKTEINGAPLASVAEEFTFLLSSMLKTAQSGAPLQTGLIDTASVGPVPADGVKDKSLEASPESAETVEVKEDAKAAAEFAVTDTPLNVFPNEFGVFAAPAELPENAPLSAPFNEFYEFSLPQKIQISVPANVPLMPPAVQGRVVDTNAIQGPAAPQADSVTGGVNIRAGQTESSPEKADAPMSEKGRIEFAASLFQGQPLKEHFEVEIPAEEILTQSVMEPAVESAIAASGKKAEVPHSSAALSQGFEQEPVERFGHSGKAEKVTIDQVRGQQADMSGFAFQGAEGQGQNSQNDSGAANSQPVQEAQAGKPENIMNGLSFEKLIDAPAGQPSAAPVRVAPLAAEVQEKVQAGIKVSLEQGGGEVKMKLNPESLGEVRIKLNVASGVVRAEIIVESSEVKRIIEADSSFLRDSLGAHGLTLDKCVVEVGRSFEAGNREKSGESLSGDEQRPMKDRDEKENRENSGWHRHFRKNQARHEDGGVDFFI